MLNIDKKLYSDIKAYCKVNGIDDVDKFCGNLLEKAFTSEKYGAVPNIVPTKDVEKKIEELNITIDGCASINNLQSYKYFLSL